MKQTKEAQAATVRTVCEALRDILAGGKYPIGQSAVLMDAEAASVCNGVNEPIYVTRIQINGTDGLIIHYGMEPGGLWTGSVLIPAHNLTPDADGDCEAADGVEWFLYIMNYLFNVK